MIVLNSIPRSSFSDNLTFLDISDVPGLAIAILFLFIAYRKVKLAKKQPQPHSHSIDPYNEIKVETFDVLMQPKKEYNSHLKPLFHFRSPISISSELLLAIVLLVFYYFLFTEVL